MPVANLFNYYHIMLLHEFSQNSAKAKPVFTEFLETGKINNFCLQDTDRQGDTLAEKR